jgi:hypothetical protein
VGIYNEKTVTPGGHGPFLPALDTAISLLTKNSNAACAMALLFLSDGKPSDWFLNRDITKEDWNNQIVEKVESLAKQFGRRLTFSAMGVGDMVDFVTLERMVDAAKDYGAIAHFSNPSKTSIAIGGVFTALSSTLTATQTEMTDMDTLKQHQVRSVVRESRRKARLPISIVSEEDFFVYNPQRVERLVYREWLDDDRKRRSAFEKAPLQHDSARCVAFSRGPFGEGAERYAYRFYELKADQRTIVGPALVAKESRLVLETNTGGDQARWDFVKKFCHAQQLARRLATEFNITLQQTRRAHRSMPKIAFLDCSVYKLDDHKLGKMSVLVEEKLDDDKWHKWNTNNGYVEGMTSAPDLSEADISKAMQDLDIIEEGSEDEEESDEEEQEAYNKVDKRWQTLAPRCFTPLRSPRPFHTTHILLQEGNAWYATYREFLMKVTMCYDFPTQLSTTTADQDVGKYTVVRTKERAELASSLPLTRSIVGISADS